MAISYSMIQTLGTDTSITVSFSASVTLPSTALTGIDYSFDAGATYTTLPIPTLYAGYGQVVITGLTNGTAYTVITRAITATETSSWSSPLTVKPGTWFITKTTADNIRISFNPLMSPYPNYFPVSGGVPAFMALMGLGKDTAGINYANFYYDAKYGYTTSYGDYHTAEIGNITSTLLGPAQRVATTASPYVVMSDSSSVRIDYLFGNISATPAVPPDPPVILSVVPGNGICTVNIAPPVNTGSSALVAYGVGGAPGVSSPDYYPATTTSIVFTGPNGTSYSTRFRSRNQQGNGASTNVLISFVATSPTAPTITTVTPGNGALTVAFTAPSSDGGSPITGYDYSLDAGLTFTSIGISSPFVIAGLTNGTTYSVTLRAKNSIATGPWSAPETGTPLTVPSAPTITLLVPTSTTSLRVTFTPPTSDGGSAITDYQYTLNGGSPVSIGLGSNPFTISGLPPGVVYTVVLTAINAVGTGTPSAPASGTPTTPYSVAAVGDRVARVTFNSAATFPPMHVSSTRYQDALNPRSWTVQELGYLPDRILSVMSVQQVDADGYIYDILTLEAFSRSNGNAMRLIGLVELEDASPLTIDYTFPGSIQRANATDLAKATKRGVYQRDLANITTPAISNPIGGDYSELVGGTLVINSAGDYESMSGEALVKKLVMRRLISKRGDFFHLPDYGAGLGVKETFSRNNLPMLAKEIEMQVMLEPEVEAAKASVSYSVAAGALVIQVQAKMQSTGRVTSISMNLPLGSVQL